MKYNKKLRFSIYENPFSEDTKKLRRNLLVSATSSLFVGLNGKVPSTVPIFDLKTEQNPELIGWFLLIITISMLLHFVSSASIEIANWLHPQISNDNTETEIEQLIDAKASHLYEIKRPLDDKEIERFRSHLQMGSDLKAEHQLRYFYYSNNLRFIMEAIIPLALSIWAIISLSALLLQK